MLQPLHSGFVKEKLLKSKSYREFLKILILDPPNRRGEMAKVSRRAGFSSRSYLSELLSGKKGVSQDGLTRLKSALKLPKSWGQFLDSLVWLEHPEVCPKNFTPELVKIRIIQLKNEIKNQFESETIEKKVSLQLLRPQVFQVYAALGSVNKGARFDDILNRTKLDKHVVQKALSQLIESEAVSKVQENYFAFTNKADALNLKNQKDLVELIRLISIDLQKKRHDIVKSPSSLTIYSAFSVQKSKMMALKARLREAILEVMDEFQDDSGDQVEQLFVNLFHQI